VVGTAACRRSQFLTFRCERCCPTSCLWQQLWMAGEGIARLSRALARRVSIIGPIEEAVVGH